MRINHNIAALNTYRQLNAANTTQQSSMEKLSSGMRINKAGDDAAGLAISEKMRAQVRGLDQASKNAQDGISLIQTAEGALNETHDILQRMRELAVQSSNDTNTDDDRKELQKEVAQLQKEITRIGDNTEFNTQKLLDGSKGAKTTSADLTGGVKVDVTKGVKITDSSETANNSFAVIYDDGTNAVELNVKIAEGDYTDIVSFTNAFNKALKTAAEELKANTNNTTDITGGIAKFSLGFEVDNTDSATNGQVKFNLSASASTLATEKLTIKFGANTDLNNTLGITADLTVTGDATNKVTTTAPAFSTDGTNPFKWDNFKVSIEDGIASPEKVNNELKLTMDGINLTALIAEGTYQTEAALATAVKTAIGNAIDSISLGTGEGKISAQQLEAKGFRGASALADYQASLKANLDVAFNDEGKLTISNDAEMKIDETTKAAQTLGLTNVNADIKNSGISLQIGANSQQVMKIDISDMRSEALGSTVFNGEEKFVSDIDISTEEGAQQATDILDKAISQVSAERSKLGAYQNRLEHTINNLSTSSENLTAAESRIRDVDMAKEMMEQTKNSILAQAAQAMLAQANQQPQGVLQLLR